jgi:hypothetical protein
MPGIHIATALNYQNRVQNDSGITTDSAKVLAMPAYYDAWPEESYEEFVDDDRMQATICWSVPWSARVEWWQWVLGYATVKSVSVLSTQPGTGTSYTLSRLIPHQHPEYPWLYAVEVKLRSGSGAIYNRDDLTVFDSGNQPADGPDGETAFNPMLAYGEPGPGHTEPWTDGRAHYAVTYKALDYDVRSDSDLSLAPWFGSELGRYVTRTINPGIKAIGLPALAKSNFQFTGGPAGIKGGVVTSAELPLLQPLAQLEYTWHEVPAPNWTAINSTIGKTNYSAFDTNGSYFPYAAGTLLCQSPRTHHYRSKTGRWVWRITYRFDWLQNGWNNFPASDGNFYSAAFSNGQLLYQQADFNQLFTIKS